MPKTFYTDRDIEDMFSQGVTSLVINDNVVVTDLAREKGMKIGFEFVREDKAKQSNKTVAKDRQKPQLGKQPGKTIQVKSQVDNKIDLQEKVNKAVMARLGDSVDPKLLKTIVNRVLKSVGGS